MTLSRRAMLTGMACVPPALLLGCQRIGGLSFGGDLVGPDVSLGHRVRDGQLNVQPRVSVKTDVLIVGGGVAGLSAGWELARQGAADFLITELERSPGGTSRSGKTSQSPVPWGAHYLPLPMRENRDLVALLDEIDVLESVREDGTPIPREEVLCRDPEERVFFEGEWFEGLYPFEGATEDDLAQLKRFRDEISYWANWRDDQGRRAFAIPIADSSDAEEVLALDQRSMSSWLDERQLDSKRLRWLIDYSCRDDYGLRTEDTSAWAGLFYFAARQRDGQAESQPLLTWPEGNGFLVNHLASQLQDHLRLGQVVYKVEPVGERWRVLAMNGTSSEVTEYDARQVIMTAPQFVVPHVVQGLPSELNESRRAFEYGSWLVANIEISDRPASQGFALSWDNVLYDSPSLGYVVATHQRGIDHGPTVLTYYYAFCHEDPKQARRELLSMTWEDCAKLVVADLEQAHPDIKSLITNMDVMRWGHAMIQPRPGVISGAEREQATTSWQGLHFANTDLSGVALFEEAFYHGVRVARATKASS